MPWKRLLLLVPVGLILAVISTIVWPDSSIAPAVSFGVVIAVLVAVSQSAQRRAPDPADIPVRRQKWAAALSGLFGLAMIAWGIWMFVALGPSADLSHRRPVIVIGPLVIAGGAGFLWVTGHVIRRIRS